MEKALYNLVLICLCIQWGAVQATEIIAASIAEHQTQNHKGQSGNLFLNDETISLQFELKIPIEDQGFDSQLFIVALTNDRFYMKTAARQWQSWDGQPATLLPYQSKTLQAVETLHVLEQEQLPKGEYLAYAGFLSRKGDIIYHPIPASLIVFDKLSAQLQTAHHRATLNEFLSTSTGNFYRFGPGFLETAVLASPSEDSNAVSQTNIQEAGVDEADRIKTVGNTLYSLEACSKNTSECLTSYQLNEQPASALQLGTIDLNSNYKQGVLYAPPISKQHPKQQLLWLSKTQQYAPFQVRIALPAPQQISTELLFIDVSDQAAMKITRQLQFDGMVLSSRLIDNALYLVTQYNPVNIIPFEDSQTVESKPAYPSLSIDGQTANELNSDDCLMVPKSSDSLMYPNLYTLIRIPIDDPENYQAQCIVGSVETLYASTEAVYLASTRYAYQASGNTVFYPGSVTHNTDIHKFAILGNGFEYRASGQVPGHLGWEMDKKSFRMGESNGILKIATSQGETWDNTATTQVSVLSEDTQVQQLKTLATLPNLGKPGERLYAARFIGDRGYLVTFKVTDPLYVLDFSNPEQPSVLGELEIDGYSDYLHPVSENYLIGIGKSAIADANTDRGAWYQGLKLSLFDLTDPGNIIEVNSLEIGQRGSSSALLHDHHALAWLPGQSGQPGSLALPVDLHDTAPQHEGVDLNDPRTFYQWSHTGLYHFSVNTSDNPGISLTGRLITEALDTGDSQSFNSHNDRAVIQGETVHYVHDNQVFSSTVQDLQ